MKKNEYMDELRKMAEIDDNEDTVQNTEEVQGGQTEEQPEEPLDMEGSIECKIKIYKKDMRHFLLALL